MTIRADEPKSDQILGFDPSELRREHVSTIGVPLPQRIENSLVPDNTIDCDLNLDDEYSTNSVADTLDDKYLSFSELVAALRGDGTGYVKMLIGDLSLKEISQISYGAKTSIKKSVKVLLLYSF